MHKRFFLLCRFYLQGSFEDFRVNSVSPMLPSSLHDSFQNFDFDNFFPPLHEVLHSALEENNLSFPEDVMFELNERNPINGENTDDLHASDINNALEPLNLLQPRAGEVGDLEEYTRAAMADDEQHIRQIAAAMALHDTASHMGISVNDAVSMLTSFNLVGSSDEQFQNTPPEDDAMSCNQLFWFQSKSRKKKAFAANADHNQGLWLQQKLLDKY